MTTRQANNRPAMTPRERWLALLAGEETDRIPTDYWATAEFTSRLRQALNCADQESMFRRLAIDAPRHVHPRHRLGHHPDDPQADIWGVRHRRIDYGTGSYDEVDSHPLAGVGSAGDVESFRWPSPDDFDYEPVRQAVAEDDGYRLIRAGSYEPFLLYCAMRGMEQAYMDLLECPDIAAAILGRLFEIHYEHNRRIFEAGGGKVALFYLAEDLGGQHGPLFSLETYRRFLRPGQQKMAALAHSYGVKVFFHTDGASREFLPDLIDVIRIDVLNPIQWRCPGMERERLVEDYGRRIVFHGAMDNQQTLPFGTVEDVVREVNENREIFRHARWICAPCHNIQPVTPVENAIAMYQAIGSTEPEM